MKKLVVYTVLTGSESKLRDPFVNSWSGFDRICITDDPQLRHESWEIRPVRDLGIDAHRLSRHPKILAHEYFPDYEWSLYLDNTVSLKQNPLDILAVYEQQGCSFWSFKHPLRDCIYDEAEEVIRLDLDNEAVVRSQMDFYSQRGYPKHYGLNTNPFMLRKHNDQAVVDFSKIWFSHILRYSRRDQLSFNFVAALCGLDHRPFNGSVSENSYMHWPGYKRQFRLPRNFDPAFYSWVNYDAKLSGLSAVDHYLKAGRYQDRLYAERSWELDKLSNKYRTDKGSLYFNAHGYSFNYERYFKEFKDRAIKVLEIGLLRYDVQVLTSGEPFDEAPSLFVWQEYFPRAEIFGFDILDFSNVPLRDRMTIIQGDMGNVDDLTKLKQYGPFDIIIDDASQCSHHQQIALANLFDSLNPGGYYVIEDLNYQTKELEIKGATITTDILHELANGRIVPTPYISADDLEKIFNNVEFIRFHDSFEKKFSYPPADNIVFIKKSTNLSSRMSNKLSMVKDGYLADGSFRKPKFYNALLVRVRLKLSSLVKRMLFRLFNKL